MRCARCGHENRAKAKFCEECGVALTGGTQPPAAAPGEKKHITVLFADVAGSMDLQENLDPEVWAGIMGRFVVILAEGVRMYGGTVDKFTGDGIMALFGAPVAQEDHARRACHSAWHLTQAIAAYADDLRDGAGVELHVRIGLNSGEVVVGRVGDDVTLDPTALGHAVGLAQRMEAAAQPGRAYLTEHTARLVEGWFSVEDLGPTRLKGASQPLRVYALVGPSPSPALRRARSLGTAPLVGRERELNMLEEGLTSAMEGHAQVVGVVGEAGVGKSRLCEEFVRSAGQRGVMVRRSSGVSHGRDVPLLPIVALLRDYFGVTEADDPARARGKVTQRALELDPEVAEDLPLLLDLLDLPDPAARSPRLPPDLRMQRTFEALGRLVKRRSEQDGLLLLVEDLHWFDPQSEAFLERLIASYPGSRTLVLTNFRPEFSAGWMRSSTYRHVPLAPLREKAVGELLVGLLGPDPSLTPLVSFVLERTNGNPFFVEEVVRALIEDGTLLGEPGAYRLSRPLQDVKVPARVQAVLAARIDRLAPVHKEVLQTAAVIGRVFPEAVLARATGLQADALADALAVLCGAELLQQTQPRPVEEYRFWHPLTQDVAYGSLLAERRARLHAAVADAWVAADPTRHDERAALIASHYGQAGRHLDAARWEYRAATWGQRRDLAESARRWRAVLTHVGSDGETEEGTRLGIQARLQLLRAAGRTGMSHEDAEVLFAEARKAAERLGDPSLLVMVLYGRGVELSVRGETRRGQETWLEAVRLVSALPDPGLRAVVFLAAVIGSAYVGPLDDGLHYAEKAEQATGGDPSLGAGIMGYSPLVRTVHFRAEVLAMAGQLDRARVEAHRALQLARERSETFTVAWAISLLARLAHLDGGAAPLDAELAAEAASLADDPGDLVVRVFALQSLGEVAMAGGDPATAREVLQRALTQGREHGLRMDEVRVLALRARAELAAHDPDAAAATADEAVDVACHQGADVMECLALLTRAGVRRALGTRFDAVLADLDAGLAVAAAQKVLTLEPFLREERGRAVDDERQLREALRLYRRIGAAGHARRLEAELAAMR